jgi:prevent-host-death family protein
MARIGVGVLKQRTACVIDRVKAGEVVEATQRGQLVARLVPVVPGPEALEHLVAEGRVVPLNSVERLPMPPVIGDPGLDVAAEVAAGRTL